MLLRRYIPAILPSWLDSIWEMKSDPSDAQHIQPVPPIGMPELIFYLGDEEQILDTKARHCLIKGQYTSLRAIAFKGPFHLLIFRLQPYGLWQLLGYDASQWKDRYEDGALHPLVCTISEILQQMASHGQAILEVLRLLENSKHLPVSQSTLSFLELARSSSSNTVEKIIERQGIGLRSLQRHFRKEVGLGPKQFLRIQRMLRLHGQLDQGQDWMDLATQNNFSDQSHFTHEFKQILQHTPSEFMEKHLNLNEILPPPELKPL